VIKYVKYSSTLYKYFIGKDRNPNYNVWKIKSRQGVLNKSNVINLSVEC